MIVIIVGETQLMRFHRWNQQQLRKQLKLLKLSQPQLQHEKSRSVLNHQAISIIKTINHQGRAIQTHFQDFTTSKTYRHFNGNDIE